MIKKTFPLLFAALISFNAFAYSNINETVNTLTINVVDQIKKDKTNLNSIISDSIMPHVDMVKMTSLAVGKDWRKATPEQKNIITEEFKNLLIKTYSNALKNYSNEKLEVSKINYSGDTEAVVKILIHQSGKPQPIILELELYKTTDWKTTDIKIAGVSLVSSYRTTFSQEIQSNGFDGLIKMLKDKNINKT